MATGGVRGMGFRWVRRDALPGLVRPCRDLSGLFGTCWGLSGNAQRLFMQAEVHALDLRVQLQANPNAVPLAWSIKSASSRNAKATSTGPKASSWQVAARG